MLKLETEEELTALTTGNVKESLHLEYKASPATDKKDDGKKIEMARDVSAFANSDGGQIIYGITENKEHEPAGLDGGLDPKLYPTIWFEQVIQQHVTPHIQGLQVAHVPLSNGNVAVVITVPSGKSDPHQVSDGRYYRRHNFLKLPMEHYEIRAHFNRLTVPEPFVELRVGQSGRTTKLKFMSENEWSEPIPFLAYIGNRSNAPALYTQITIGVDSDFYVMSNGGFQPAGEFREGKTNHRLLRMAWTVKDQMPVFKEAMLPLFNPSLELSIHETQVASARFYFTVEVLTPGFSSREDWFFDVEQGVCRLLGPRRPD